MHSCLPLRLLFLLYPFFPYLSVPLFSFTETFLLSSHLSLYFLPLPLPFLFIFPLGFGSNITRIMIWDYQSCSTKQGDEPVCLKMIRKILQFSRQGMTRSWTGGHGEGKERIEVRGVVKLELTASQSRERPEPTFRSSGNHLHIITVNFSTANSVIAMWTSAICPLYA